MRRGRPGLSGYFRQEIVTILSATRYPVTASTIKKTLEERRGRPCSWNTVQKYLHRLCEERLVYRQELPTEGHHKPLVVYFTRDP